MAKPPAKLDPRQEKFLEILFHPEVRGDLELAKVTAGWPETESLTNILTDDFCKAIDRKTDQYLALLTPQALTSIVDVMHSPNRPGNQYLLKAAESILDRRGLGKKETLQIDQRVLNAVMVIPKKQLLDELPADSFVVIDGSANETTEI